MEEEAGEGEVDLLVTQLFSSQLMEGNEDCKGAEGAEDAGRVGVETGGQTAGGDGTGGADSSTRSRTRVLARLMRISRSDVIEKGGDAIKYKRPGMKRCELEKYFLDRMKVADREACSTQELVEIHRQEILLSLSSSIDDVNEWFEALTNEYLCPRHDEDASWQLEHIRCFSIELSSLAVNLRYVCTAETCPQMKATDEWMYLCAAHKQPQECSAIDYIIHTLDGTCALLNSNKWFPWNARIPSSSLKYFQSITRRLYRVLSHCFFHHKEIFEDFEKNNHLCLRFVAFAKAHDLIPPKLLIIPQSGFLSCVHTQTQQS